MKIEKLKISICVPIQATTQKEAKKAMKEIAGKADMAELWLDYIKDLDIADLLKNKPLPVLCVCKMPAEKGKFRGTRAQAVDLLVKAAEFGAEYIDISHSSYSNQKSQIRNHKSTLILSYHNFTKTPPLTTLIKKAEAMRHAGADIIKIAVMPKSLKDTVSIIMLAKHLESKKIPHILIAMGKMGALSRILTPTLGGTIMFAPLSTSKTSAPGQLTVKELKEAWNLIDK